MNAAYYRGKLSVDTDIGKFQKELKSKFEISTTSFETTIEDVIIVCNELSNTHFTAAIVNLENDLKVFSKCDILILD